MVAGFNEALRNAAQVDFFTGVTPFILAFVLFYLGLQRIPLVKDANKGVPFILSTFLAGLLSNFLIQNPVYQSFFTQFIGRVSLGLLGLIGLFSLLGFVGYQSLIEDSETLQSIFAFLAVGLTIAAFVGAGGIGLYLPEVMIPGTGIQLSGISDFIFEEGGWVFIIPAAVFVYFALASISTSDDDGPEGLSEIVGDYLADN